MALTSLLVAIGGALGAVLRYWIGTAVQSAWPLLPFPLGTLAVNVSGCFVMGLVTGLGERHGYLTAEWRAFVAVGVLGGFTTFSAFANETVGAVRAGATAVGALNVAASVALCLLALVAGRLAAGLWAR